MKTKAVFNIPKTVREDTLKYKELVEKFKKGELSSERFKGYRVPMGIYGQRTEGVQEDEYMVRVRIPAGFLTKEQLKVLAEISREYGNSFLHITTRQDIQIHQVKIEDTPEILFKLMENNLSPRGGGGNTVRNIVVSARAGVDPKEAFDPTPHALALSEYLLKSRSSFNLPRKYKIAFSVSPEDDALATISDLGFIAKVKDDKRGFKVYAGGGMGNSPRLGILLEEFILEDKIFHIAEAIKRFFDQYGDRNNKHQARLRFVLERLGEKEFVIKYREYLDEVIKEEIEVEKINYYQIKYKESFLEDNNGEKWESYDNIFPEKSTAYYSLELRPENGDMDYDSLISLLSLIEENQDISIRTSNKQGLMLRGIKGNELENLLEKIKNIDEGFLIPNYAARPVACKGASTCRLGLCLSPNLAVAINKELSNLSPELQNKLPQIYISGCPNSCGQHHIGKIGLEGKAKRYQGKLVPHYSLLLGGKIKEDESRYNQKFLDLPARNIPKFLVKLAEHLAGIPGYKEEDFNQYLDDKGLAEIKKIAQEFTQIPPYNENPLIYRDLGQDKDFSLAGRGAGECGIGVLDIIKLDIQMAKGEYQEGIKEEDSDKLYQAIISAARSLLIVKGVDTQKDRVIIKEFKEKLVDGKLLSKDYAKLLDLALDYKLGDIADLFSFKTEIKSLITRVDKLFNSLNAKLEFNLIDENKKEENENNKEKEESNQNNILDLRGVKCPLNFVKAKLFIEPLAKGEIVEFYLDEGEPIANVPGSLEAEEHEILSKEKTGSDYYTLIIRRG